MSFLRNVTLVLLVAFSFISVKAQELVQPSVLGLDWHPTENWVAVADTEGLRVINTSTQLVMRTFPVQSAPVYKTAWSPDGARLASSGADGTLQVWNSYTGELLASLAGHTDIVNAIVWNSEGSLLASSSVEFDGALVKIWDTNEYQLISTQAGGFLGSLTWSHDNQHIFVATMSGAYAYDVLGGSSFYRITSEAEIEAASITLNPNSNIAAVGAWDGTIYLVDAVTQEEINVLIGHTDVVSGLTWNDDGTVLFSVSVDGSIKSWDAETGKPLTNFSQSQRLFSIALSSENEVAYGGENMGGSNDGVRILQFPTADAGPDQTLSDSDNSGSEFVTLDAAASSDPDGSIVSYVWSENGVQIATGVSPQVDLGVGVHSITLTITDDDGATAVDELTITVEAPTACASHCVTGLALISADSDSDFYAAPP